MPIPYILALSHTCTDSGSAVTEYSSIFHRYAGDHPAGAVSGPRALSEDFLPWAVALYAQSVYPPGSWAPVTGDGCRLHQPWRPHPPLRIEFPGERADINPAHNVGTSRSAQRFKIIPASHGREFNAVGQHTSSGATAIATGMLSQTIPMRPSSTRMTATGA